MARIASRRPAPVLGLRTGTAGFDPVEVGVDLSQRPAASLRLPPIPLTTRCMAMQLHVSPRASGSANSGNVPSAPPRFLLVVAA